MLVFLFSIVDRRHFVDQLMQVNVTLFAIGLACYFGYITLWAGRWHYIMRGSGEKISYRRVLTTTLIGNFFAMFLPEMVGNDLARMSEVSEERKTNARIVSTVLLDRVIGLISLVMMAMLGLLLGFHHLKDDAPAITLLVVGLFVGLGVGWLVFFNRSLMRRLNWVFRLPLADRFEAPVHSLYNALHDLQTQPRLLLVSVGMSFALQLVEIFSVIFIALSLGINVPLSYFFIFMPIIWVITMVPISISGLGVREGAFAFFFSQVGMASENAIALSLLYYSYLLCTGLVGGLLFVRASAGDYLRKRFGRRTTQDAAPAV
jgi:uncharacterized protein (TIRG00374 family)